MLAPVSIAEGAAPNGSAPSVALLRVDSGLRDAVPPGERAVAHRAVVALRREVGPGPWSPEALVGDASRPFAALLLEGVVMHEVSLGGRCNASLLGEGDVFRPWRPIDTVLDCTSRWTCISPATIAVLDGRFLAAAHRWPGLTTVIHDRLADQLDAAALRTAIVALPRVEERVLALFWQLADRWGVVRPEGVVIRLALTHAVIGQLVGAQRPTVTLALGRLAEDQLLRRSSTGAWILRSDSHEALGCDFERDPRRPPTGAAHPLVRRLGPAAVPSETAVRRL